MTMQFLPDVKIHGEMQNLEKNWNKSSGVWIMGLQSPKTLK